LPVKHYGWRSNVSGKEEWEYLKEITKEGKLNVKEVSALLNKKYKKYRKDRTVEGIRKKCGAMGLTLAPCVLSGDGSRWNVKYDKTTENAFLFSMNTALLTLEEITNSLNEKFSGCRPPRTEEAVRSKLYASKLSYISKAPEKGGRTFLEPEEEPRILLWDIECTHLKADFGVILMIGFKFLEEEEVHIIQINDFPLWQKDRTDDREVVKAFIEVMKTADIQVTWFGTYFDIPYLQSRALAGGMMGPIPQIPHVDGWWIAKKKLCLTSNRMANVQKFLNLPESKTPVSGREWRRAGAGHEDALEYIRDHCKKDIVILEDAYRTLRPLLPTHPNYNVIKETLYRCPVCGSSNLIKAGFRITRTTKWQRFKCKEKDCGAYSSAPVSGKRVVR